MRVIGRCFRILLWTAAIAAGFAGCTKTAYQGPAPSDGATPPPKPPALLLLDLSPRDGASDVPVDTAIEAVFSRAPDPATVTSVTFALIDEVAGVPVPADVAQAPGDAARFVLTPRRALDAPSHPYLVRIEPCIAAADGARLDVIASPVALTTRFTTGRAPDTTPPRFFFYAHRAEAVGPTAIKLAWFPAVDAEGGSPMHKLRYAIYMGPAADAIDTTQRRALTEPGAAATTISGLTPGTTYHFIIRPVDEAGNEDDNTVTVSAHTWVEAETTDLTLLYTADVFSMLEPCG